MARLVLHDEHPALRQSGHELLYFRPQAIEKKLLGLVLNIAVRIRRELDHLDQGILVDEAIDGYRPPPVPAESDLIERVGIEIDSDTLIRRPVSLDDHGVRSGVRVEQSLEFLRRQIGRGA